MSAPADVFEAAVQHHAEMAALTRDNALSALGHHVGYAAEVIRSRVAERGGTADERETEVAGMIDVLRAEVNAHLDRLAAKRPGS